MSGVIRLILPGALLLAAASATSFASADPPADTSTQPAATSTKASTTTTVSSATVKANPEDKIICKTETPIGSRLGGHRTCMKKSDWDVQAADARHYRDFAPPSAGSTSH